MKIALLADIHANLPALEAVLAHILPQEPDAIWNAGDSVGYGPFPNQVLDLLQEKDVLSILGNYDLKVLKFPDKGPKWRKKKHPLKLIAFQWTWESLQPANRAYLRALPEQRRFKALEREVLLTHASPVSNHEYVDSHTSPSRLRQLAIAAAAQMVIYGHSHRAFVGQAEDVWFINPGSVGRPDDGDPRASYALLCLSDKKAEVYHHRVPYDVERTARAILEQHLPLEFSQMFLQGRALDDLKS